MFVVCDLMLLFAAKALRTHWSRLGGELAQAGAGQGKRVAAPNAVVVVAVGVTGAEVVVVVVVMAVMVVMVVVVMRAVAVVLGQAVGVIAVVAPIAVAAAFAPMTEHMLQRMWRTKVPPVSFPSLARSLAPSPFLSLSPSSLSSV